MRLRQSGARWTLYFPPPPISGTFESCLRYGRQNRSTTCNEGGRGPLVAEVRLVNLPDLAFPLAAVQIPLGLVPRLRDPDPEALPPVHGFRIRRRQRGRQVDDRRRDPRRAACRPSGRLLSVASLRQPGPCPFQYVDSAHERLGPCKSGFSPPPTGPPPLARAHRAPPLQHHAARPGPSRRGAPHPRLFGRAALRTASRRRGAILCLGDSNTHGVHYAADEAYPGHLRSCWMSVRRSLPRAQARSPRDELLADRATLAGWLDRYRPYAVVVAAGLNNLWVLPASAWVEVQAPQLK